MSSKTGDSAVNPRPNPYVGPRSIEAGEPLYGRDRELDEVLNVLISRRIVLLYSPSGAGKSSLLEAGLRGQLEARGYRVAPTVRIGHTVRAGVNRYVMSTLLSLEEAFRPEEQLSDEALSEWDLDSYLHRLAAHLLSEDRDLCLFFDQFEELFTLDPTDQGDKRAFLAQLGVALRNRSRWALMSMREDYIAQLDPYVSLAPTRLSNRYRLELLGPDAAKQAARRPALDNGVNFSEDAADRLIDDLRRVRVRRGDAVSLELGPHVEPVQLQVVCHRLWNRLSS